MKCKKAEGFFIGGNALSFLRVNKLSKREASSSMGGKKLPERENKGMIGIGGVRARIRLSALPRKGQTEFSEFVMKIIGLMLFIVFLVAGIMQISQFKVTVNENSFDRLGIDFGENVLAAPCLAEKKGLFNETMLNGEIDYGTSHPEDRDGISCLSTSAMLLAKIKTEKKEWFFGTHRLKSSDSPQWTLFEFPAALNDSSGNIVPAKVLVIDYNRFSAKYACNNIYEGFICYNCITKASCEKEGCRWDVDTCKP